MRCSPFKKLIMRSYSCRNIALLSLLLLPFLVRSQCTEANASTDGTVAGSIIAQSFTSSCDGNVTDVSFDLGLILGGDLSITNATISIRTGNDPAGAIVGSSLTGQTLTPSSTNNFDFSGLAVNVTNGSTYTLVIDDNGDTDNFNINRSSANPYDPGGSIWVDGAEDTGTDVVFSITVNDLPTATAPSAPTVNEDDTNVALADDIQIADGDGDNQTLTFTITGGTVTLGTTGITFGGSGNGSANFTASGTLAALNTALDAATFTPTPDLNGTNAGTIQFVSNDGAGNGNTASVTFDIIAQNDPPSATAPSAPTVNEDDTNVALADDIQVADVDGDNQTLTFTITGGTVTLGTTGITFGGSGNGSASFTAAGTLANLNTALDAATFTPTPDLNGTNAGTIQFVSNDGTINGNTASVTFNIVAVNDAPSIANLNGDSFTYNEGSGAQVIDQTTVATLTDVDAPTDLNGGNLTVTIFSGEDAAEDLLSFNTSGTINLVGTTAGDDVQVSAVTIGTLGNTITEGADLVVNLNGSSTLAAVQTLIQGITYENTDGANPTTGDRVVRVTVDDNDGGTSTSANNDVTITVAGLNDAPVATPPSAPTVNEDDTNVSLADDIQVADDDGDNQTLTFTITGGTVTLGTTGITFGGGGNGSASFTAQGTLANLNTALDAATFTPTPDLNGTNAGTIQFISNDGTTDGNTASVTFNIVAINDAPSIANLNGDAFTYDEGDGAQVIDQGTVAALTDVDAPTDLNGGNLTVTIFSGEDAAEDLLSFNTSGTINLVGTTAGDDVQVSLVTIGTLGNTITEGADLVVNLNASATLAAVQTLIQGITYENTDTNNPTEGDRVVRVTVDDNDGGTSISTNNDVTITVQEVNDPPTSSDNTVTAEEDVTYTFTNGNFAFTDAAEGDAFQQVYVISLPSSGTLQYNGVNAVTGTGTSYTDRTLFTYLADPDENGTSFDSFTFQVRDDGGTPNGGSDVSGTFTMTIDVTAINDEPTFGALSNQAVGSGDGAQSVLTFIDPLTDITFGPTDESAQTVFDFVVGISSDPNGVIGSIDILNTGELQYTPNSQTQGVAIIDVQVQDNGGTAGTGADDTSPVVQFQITVTDNEVPEVENPGTTDFTPADGATGVAATNALQIVFDEDVVIGTGNIVVFDAAGPTQVASVDVTDATLVTETNGTVDIDLENNWLIRGKEYYVQIDATAFVDTNQGLAYPGISNTVTWNFTMATAASSGPNLLATIPANGETDVLTNQPIMLIFDELIEEVDGGGGTSNFSLDIESSLTGPIATDNVLVINISPNDDSDFGLNGTVTNSSNVAIINLAENPAVITGGISSGSLPFTFQENTFYSFELDAGAFYDGNGPGNNQAAISKVYFQTVLDGSPPVAVTFTPDGVSVPSTTNSISVQFDEDVQAGSGNIEIYADTNPDYLVASFPSNDAAVTYGSAAFTTDLVTIDISGITLSGGITYYVNIDAGAFEDATGNGYVGIADETTWSFSVDPETNIPVLVSRTPDDNATDVAIGTDFVLEFDEPVFQGAGTVSLRLSATNSLVQTLDASALTFAGNTVTLDFGSDLSGLTQYYITVPSGVIQDNGGTAYDGFITTSAYNFTSESGTDVSGPTITLTSPDDLETDVAVNSDITLIFNEPVSILTGNIDLDYSGNGAGTDVSIDVTTGTVTSNSVTLPAGSVSAFPFGETVDVTVNATTFEDQFFNANGSYSFSFDTEADLQAPIITPVTPADDATGVAIANPSLNFTTDENVNLGSSVDIRILRASDLMAVATLNTTTDAGSFTGDGTSSITMDFTGVTLDEETEYFVQIPANAFLDTSPATNGNDAFGGTDESWSFTTIADVVAPTLVITRGTVTNGDPDTGTNDNQVVFDLAFSEPIDDATFSVADITVNAIDVTFTALSGGDLVNSGDDQNYTLTILGVTEGGAAGDGTIGITVGPTINDQAAAPNAMVAAEGPSTTFTIDQTAPTAPNVSIASNNGTNTNQAITSDVVTLTFNVDDDLEADPTVTFSSGGSLVNGGVTVGGVNPNYTADYTVSGADEDGNVTFTIDFTDDAGNVATQVTSVVGAGAATSVNIDNITPTITVTTLETINTLSQTLEGVLSTNGDADESTDDLSISVTIDGGAPLVATNDLDGTWSLNVFQGIGIYDIDATVTDLAGNSSTNLSDTDDELQVGDITITAPTLGNICIDGPSSGLGAIILTENKENGFKVGTDVTLFLNLPSDFEFDTGATISETGTHNDISGVNFTYLGTQTLRIEFDVNSLTNIDALRIENIAILATGATPATQNATFTNGTASIFDLTNGDAAATLTSVSAPSAPNVRLTNAFGTIVTETEIRVGSGTSALYNDGSGTAYRWYDYALNQISTLQNPTLTNLTAGGPNDEIGFDHNTAGLYTLYASTINAAGCESPLTQVNIFVYDRTLNPNQTSFDASDNVGTTITFARDQTVFDGTFSGPGLTGITETATEEEADFIPSTAGDGSHPVVFEIDNLTTGESYSMVTTFTVTNTATIFVNTSNPIPPTVYCNTSDESVIFDIEITDIPAGFFFYEVGLYSGSTEVIGAINPPVLYSVPGIISGHLVSEGWTFDPTDAGAGNYLVRRFIVPNGSLTPELDKFEFVNETFTVNEVPTVQLPAISDLCETDGMQELRVRITTGVVSAIQTPSDFLVSYIGPGTPGILNVQYTVSGNLLNPADPLDTAANGLSLATNLPANYPVGDYQLDYISEAGFDPLGNGCTNSAAPELFSIIGKPNKPVLITDLTGIGELDIDDDNGNSFTDDYFLEFCSGETVPNLEADGSGGIINWYTSEGGAPVLANTTTFDVAAVFGTNVFTGNVIQNFFFAVTDVNGCESDFRRVNVAIRDFPAADIVNLPVSPSGELEFVGGEFYFEYCADPGENVSLSLDDIELFFSAGTSGNLPANGLNYFEIFEGDATTLSQTITFAGGGGAIGGRTLELISDIGLPGVASSDVDNALDTTIYVRRVIFDRVSLDGTEEFVGCEETLYPINIAIYTRSEAPGEGGGEFSGDFVLDSGTGNIEYYMCRDEQFPVRITDPQVSGSNYLYRWYSDGAGASPLGVADPFGERPTAAELGVDVSTPNTYTVYTNLRANVNLASGFNDGVADCEGPIRQVNVNVFDVPNIPSVTSGGDLGTPTSSFVNRVYNFCTENGQLDPTVTFTVGDDVASSGGRFTYFNWYVSNAVGDQGTLQSRTTATDVDALELSISGIANQTRYFLVTQTTDVIEDVDGSTIYDGCESGGYLVQINFGSIPTPEFTYIGITEGRGTTFDLSDASNVSIAASSLTIRDASNNVVGTFDAMATDVNSTNDEFTINTLVPGEYSVEYTILSNSSCDSTIYRRLTILDHLTAAEIPNGYEATFESGNGGWFAEYVQTDAKIGGTLDGHLGAGGASLFDDRISSWALQAPVGSTISGGGDGSNIAWVTDQSTRTNYTNNGQTTYYGGEVSFVYSPSFDLTGIERPGVGLWTNSDFNSFRDGVVLQFSTDDGRTWSNVGSFDSGLGANASSGNNWYTNESITGGPGTSRPGEATPPVPYNPNNSGWSEDADFTQEGWVQSTNILTIPNSQSPEFVRFRLALGATGSISDTDLSDGFGFDEFTIFDRGKVVLVEQFSSSVSPASKTFNDNFQAGINSNETLLINYYTDLANDFLNEDMLNARNTSGPGAKASYYGIETVPQAVISGDISNTTDVNQVQTLVQKAALDDQLFDIQLIPNTSLSSDQVGLTSATFDFNSSSSVLDAASEMVSFHFIIIEPFVTGLDISRDTGNGTVQVYSPTDTLWNVMRKALPDPGGFVVSGPINATSAPIVFNDITWDVTNIYGDSLVMIAYVQNQETQEIFQAAAVGFGGLDNTVLGVDEELKTFSLYPNPADKEVTIEFADPITEDIDWAIFDQTGREVVKGELTRGTKTMTVQTADMPSGLYFIHLTGDQQQQVRRVIVVH